MSEEQTLAERAKTAYLERQQERIQKAAAENAEQAELYQQRRNEVYQQAIDLLSKHLDLDESDWYISVMVMSNGVAANPPYTSVPDAALIRTAEDDIPLLVGDTKGLAWGGDTPGIWLAENRRDSTSGYYYWSATGKPIESLADLGEALERRQ